MLSPNDIPLMDLGDRCSRIKDQLDKRDRNNLEVDPKHISHFNILLSDVQYGIDERTELIQFLKDILHNKNLFHEDDKHIKLGNDKEYKYSSLRKQLYLSLFAMIGGVYDSSARLCILALDTGGGIKKQCYIHDIFFGNKKITFGHKDVIGKLKTKYGYFLGVIVYLRNFFVHRGESFLGGKSLFQSNECNDFDSLNPDVLNEIEDKADYDYKVKAYRNKEPELSTFKNKPLIELVDTYLLYADHAIGLLINSLLGKWVGVC